ncbi:MAG: TetR/AcrR family transcriptional regulator, partial [Lachnospiraceae bacterium]|nr:TetR/AcrR family transcriptional regulator [Lachnospiraceae bacterium]
ERHYKKALETAKNLAEQTDIPVFTRMATLFQACRNSSFAFLIQSNKRLCEHETKDTSQEYAYLIHKFLEYTIAELMPSLTAIIEQGIANGDIHFDYPKELAKIVLIVLSVVLANGTISTSPTEIEQTIHALISLLEKGTETPPGSLDYLINF